MRREKGSLSRAAGSEQSAVARPSATAGSAPVPSVCLRAGRRAGPGWEEPGQPGTGVWEASVGRWPFQGQADVWSERGRQTVSPCSHLGLGLGPPGAGTPPVAGPHCCPD